jgi:uncharacterized protein YjbJ (UPF0337 family)
MGEIIDKVKGKVKQAEGEITGNQQRKAEGKLDELKGDMKGKFEDLKHDIEDVKHDIKERIRERKGNRPTEE